MIISIFFFIIIVFQLFYLISSIFTSPLKENKLKAENTISIIIPLYNGEKTISKCLESILTNKLKLIKTVIIVLDHCTDSSLKVIHSFDDKFRKNNVGLDLYFLKKKTGKVEGLLEGFRHVCTDQVMILDSDIVLNSNAIEKLLSFHEQKQNLYSSCFIYPYVLQKRNKVLNVIIDNDRLYRQNILQRTRNNFGLANFPGGIGIIDIKKYREKLKSGFLEDLTATYKIIQKDNQINIFPEPLAFEIERNSLKGVLLQRTRWTIGNIENIKYLIQTIKSKKKYMAKIILLSYPIMWYLQHYFISLGIILFLFKSFKLIYLLPQIFYLLQIMFSAYLGRKYYKNSMFGILLHSIIYPFIISLSLITALILIIKNKKTFFKNELLFNRI